MKNLCLTFTFVEYESKFEHLISKLARLSERDSEISEQKKILALLLNEEKIGDYERSTEMDPVMGAFYTWKNPNTNLRVTIVNFEKNRWTVHIYLGNIKITINDIPSEN